MFTIRPTDNGFEVVAADGTVVVTATTAAEAMAAVEARLAAMQEEGEGAPEAARAFEAWLAPLDTDTSDGRRLDADGYSTRSMPLPLMWQTETQIGHDGAVLAGRIDEVWVDDDNWLRARGVFDDTEEGRGAVEDLQNRITDERPAGWFGLSIDPAVTEVDFVCTQEDPEDGFCLDGIEVYLAWELMGATGTPFPAFAEAGIMLAEGSSDDVQPAEAAASARTFALDDAQTANVAEAIGQARTQAEAAAGALGGEPDEDDLTAARDAIGTVIEECDAATRMINDAESDDDEGDGEAAAEEEALVASAAPTSAPPASWFDDPGLDGPTALTITDDGRVYGHLATWGTCHIGREDVCLTPPSSQAGYAYYRTGETLTACDDCGDGEAVEVPTGTITLGTNHADLGARARPAMEHYDNTGTAVADVAAGEDAHGIWIAGALRPDVSEDQVAALRASSLSGDWRRIGGNLELVAALAVNVPGFPVPRSVAASATPAESPRVRAHAQRGRQTALVAAGSVERSPEEQETMGRHPAGLSDEDRRSLRRVERALAPQYAASLRAEVHGGREPDDDTPPVEPISLDATRAMKTRRASAAR